MLNRYSRRIIAVAALAITLSLSSVACICGGLQQLSSSKLFARPTRTPTVQIPRATATRVPAPTRTPSQLPPEVLRLVDPAPEEINKAISELPVGGRFQILLHEKYVEEQALAYLDSGPELPIAVSDIEVDFEPGEVAVSALVPVGFLRVEALARGRWAARDCVFEVQIVKVTVAGAAAPATLREQISNLLAEGLKSLEKSPVCFTRVEIREGEVQIDGYKK